jgi:hypothetical protein
MSDFKFAAMDINKDDLVDMQFEVTGARPRRAKCIEIARVSTKGYSTPRWRNYIVHMTAKRNLLLERHDITIYENEQNRFYCYVFKCMAELRAFFDCNDIDPAFEDGIKRIGRAEQELMNALTVLGVDIAEEVD